MTVEGTVVATRQLDKDPHFRWMLSIARLEWVVRATRDRSIIAGNIFDARERAVEAFVHLRQVTKDRMDLLEDVYAEPDYELMRDRRAYRLVLKLTMYGCEPQVITDVAVSRDLLIISTERFQVMFPIQMTDVEEQEMRRFRDLTENIDPLSGEFDEDRREVDDATRRDPRVPPQDMGRDEEAVLRQVLQGLQELRRQGRAHL